MASQFLSISCGFAPICLLNFCFFLPLFCGDFRTYRSTPTCKILQLSFDFVKSLEIREILRNLFKILKSVPPFS